MVLHLAQLTSSDGGVKVGMEGGVASCGVHGLRGIGCQKLKQIIDKEDPCK